MRRKYKQHKIHPDRVYRSIALQKMINHTMREGKKTIAEKIVYWAIEGASKEIKSNPMKLFNEACKHVAPEISVFSKKIGGTTYTIPKPVHEDSKINIAIRWIVTSSRKNKKSLPMKVALKNELVNAYKNKGAAIKIKEDLYARAKSNYSGSYGRRERKENNTNLSR